MRNLILLAIFAIAAGAKVSGAPLSLNRAETKAYEARRFFVLRHLLVLDRKKSLVQLVGLQEKDLAGCRGIDHGNGGLDSAIHCMSFLNRETKLRVRSSGYRKLSSDINILCRKLLTNREAVMKILASGVVRDERRTWAGCETSVWRQVYLTAYANFDADPAGTLSFVRRSKELLPSKSPWYAKTIRLIKGG